MSGKGGPAQARRRERRAALRKTGAAPVAAVEDEVALIDVAEFRTAVGADETFAVGDVAWDPEEGFQDLLCDVNETLNPSGAWDFPMYAFDLSTDLTKALICDWQTGDAFIANVTIGDDREPTLSQRSDWMEVEQAWVESDRYQLVREALEARRSVNADVKTIGLSNFVISSSTNTWTFGTGTGGNNLIVTPTPFDGATAPDIPAEHRPVETLPAEDGDPVVQGTEGTGMSWIATIAPEGMPTDDGRIFAPDSITWRELPLSLGAMFDTPHADVVTASPVVGRIDEIWRDGNMLYAKGEFDNSDLGREVARMVTDGTLRGVSVDIAVSEMSIAWKSEILDTDGNWIAGDLDNGPDIIDVLFDDNPEDEILYVVRAGKIGAVTICPFPAFAEANIKPASSLVAAASDMVWTLSQQHGMRVVAQKASLAASAAAEADTQEDASEPLTASVSAPLTPPAWWFDDPEFEELTPLTIEDDGQIYGHAAPWDTCHIGIPGVCTTAPQSESGYAYFHLKEVECADGERVSCGTITLGTGHAGRNLGRAAAAAHYDDTGSAVADIVCGEDEHGIWFAGAVRPGLDEKTIREFRGASVSGDWRNVNGNLEFIALLAVNVPGFPVPKMRANLVASADGFELVSLVAAGHGTGEGLTAGERAQFDALRDDLDGGFDDLQEEMS